MPHTQGPHKYQLLPPLSVDERTDLERSMREHGYDLAFPVVVDEKGAILDGHHRAEIATKLGLTYPTVVKKELTEHQKRIYAVTRNVGRRHMTDAQKVIAGEAIEPDYEAEAARRQVELAGTRSSDLPDNCPEGAKGETRDQVAQAVGLGSGRTYERGKQTLSSVKEFVRQGTVDKALPAKLANGQATMKDARKAVTKAKQKQKQAETQAVVDKAMQSTEGTALALRHKRAGLMQTLSSCMSPFYQRAFRVDDEVYAELCDEEMRERLAMYFRDLDKWEQRVTAAIAPRITRVK